ncbi:MAG: alpha-amylase family glycosyl hydrolase [Muribaculaceae bacterium]|nr:alpha-amylase family glycosyl hydrolase [Roseburia sp.]MCM1429812.1 alpha-amylase family glycosyl hydrolase [Muribaculaceae bacterium]MCM1492863.1 alpha-amylase family glycosyl hydrolase [Muribaculaceae bacterium]
MDKKTKVFKTHHGILSRFLSVILAVAMVLTLTPFGGVESVKAASGVKLYFKLPSGTSVTDWGVNAWEVADVTVDGDTDNEFRPSSWGEGANLPALKESTDHVGWGYVTITGTITGMAFVKTDATELKCWNTKIAEQNLSEAYYDPTEDKWYKEADETTEIPYPIIQNIFVLAGDSGLTKSSNWNPTDMNNKLTQDASNTNKYSITFENVQAGEYSYKILQDPESKGWDLPWGSGTGEGGNRSVTVAGAADVTFTIDLTDSSKGVTVTQKSRVNLTIKNDFIVRGSAFTLDTDAEYYDGTETSDVTVTYSLKGSPANVSLLGSAITVSDASVSEVTIVATYNGYSQEFTLPVVAKAYNVTINMYASDFDMVAGASDVYIWEYQGSGKSYEIVFDNTVEDEDNDITWVQATVSLPYSSLGLIARPTAGDWTGKDGDRTFTVDTDNVTLWYVFGKNPTTTKPTVEKKAKRYLYLEYENNDLGDVIPNFYSWTIGTAQDSKLVNFTKTGSGKYLATVQVSSTCSQVDFVIALDATADPWVKDGGDHSISFPLDQTVVYASLNKGEEPVLSAPYNIGYELQPSEEKISFYYRDDAAVLAGNAADSSVKVDINGTEQTMTYNAKNKRFEYVQNGLSDGRIHYRYKVGAEYVLDKYNENKEQYNGADYNYVEYRKLNASISATVKNPSFNYNENNLVKLEVGGTDAAALEIAEASIDVSSLGGSSKMAIDPALKAVTISVTDSTSLGAKTLPIVVKDQYGNEYSTSASVNVVARTKMSAADDFDWAESIVYFMVTDRFFDGNTANNTASGAQTYGENDGLYHGGDFAGVTQKLDYLQELGINTIWITPIVENIPGVTVTGTGAAEVPYNAAYHGYWASDFTKLNPTLGTSEEFSTLISEAHRHGIKIMVDIVINHAGYDTEGTFGEMLRSGDDVVAGDTQKAPLSGLPDFLTENAEVREQLVEWQTEWIKDYGIDYFRVDTVKHVEGTTWAALKNAEVEIDPSFKMIGEYAGGGYASNGGTLGTGQMDADLDFDFNDQATNFVTGGISAVESFMSARNAAINNTNLTGQFLGSHDEDGFKQNLMDNKHLTEAQATAASLVAATLQLTAEGIPVIYYGEEVGQTGLNNYPWQTNRYDFDWSAVNDSNVTYQHYKTLLSIRNQYTDVFARGTRTTLDASDANGYDVFSRSYNGTTLYVGMNIKDTAASVRVATGVSGVYTDLYSGTQYNSDGSGNVSVTIPAAADGGTVILVRTGAITSSSSSSTSTTTSTETAPNKVVEVAEDGSVTETVTEEATNKAGNDVKVTTVTKKDAEGNVLSTTEKSAIENIAENTSATVTVKSDAEGNVTSAKAAVTVTVTNSTKTTITSDVVEQLTDAAGQSSVKITVTVKNTSGSTKYKYKVDTADLTPGNDLYIYKVDSKTGEYVMVNKKVYEVDEKGSVSVSASKKATYELVDAAQAEKINKKIVKTVKPKKTSVTVKNGKSKTFDFDSKLNMDNVKSVVYVSSKKTVVKVSSNGKITAKKPGTATVKAKVTLKNGTVKTVKIKVKVK